MAPTRRLLAPLTAIWLVCQLGTVTLVPVTLSMGASDSHAAECTCGHGEGATCPMHHKPAGRSSTPCVLQSANPSGDAVLTSLIGIAGLIAEPTGAVGLAAPSTHASVPDDHLAAPRPVPPDPPPPRV